MEVRYRNDLYGNYMLIEIPETTDANQYSFKMLERNKIPGVLSSKERKEDGKGYLYVDISKKRNLVQEYKDKEMQLEDMIAIFQQLIPILEELRTYLLNESMVLMDPKFIFKDLEDEKLYIVILPWNQDGTMLHKLAEFFLEKINYRDENGVNAAYHFYRQHSQPQFSLYHFLPVLEKESILKRQKIKEKPDNSFKENEMKKEIWNEEPEIIEDEKDYYKMEREEAGKTLGKEVKGKVRIVFLLLALVFLALSFLPVITSVLRISCIAFALLLFVIFLFLFFKKEKPEDKNQLVEKTENTYQQKMDIGLGETVFFDSYEDDNYLKLQWKEKGRKKQFVLKDFPCTVGKMKEEVSLVISDISVSRIHCRFIEKENKIAIMDLNSTNGTFLNGLPVKEGEILEIEKNDEILIGKVRVNVV